MNSLPFKAMPALVFGVLLLMICGLPFAVAASNQSLVYQGRIQRPDGSSINSGNVTFTLSVFSPSKCLLYSESQTVSMSGANGLFSLALGNGTRIDSGAHTFADVFVNGGSLSGLTCDGGVSVYSPAATDDRKLKVTFNDAGTVVNLSEMAIKSVPFALQAQQIGGYGINDIIKVHPSIGSATTFTTSEMTKIRGIGAASCANNEILKWNGSTWVCAPDATGGGSASDAAYGPGNKGVVAFDTDAATSGISITAGLAKLSDVLGTPGSFGTASKTVSVTVNAQGRVTAISHSDIALPVGQLAQSGATNSQVLKWNGSAWAPAADVGVTADATYAAKGVVQFDTDVETSGVSVTSGVASVNTGTGANQIIKLNGSAQLPAVDGSLLTNLSAANIASGVLPIARGGTNNGSLGVTAGGILYMDGSKAMTAAAGTSGQALISTGAGAPTFGTLSVGGGGTGQSSFAPNSLLMANGTGSALTSVTCTLNQILKWDGTAWSCASDSTGTAPGDAGYTSANKGIIAFDTDAVTSGVSVTSGVAKVNFGTGANQIVKLDGSGKLPALDGSALTNLSASTVSSSGAFVNGGNAFAATATLGTNSNHNLEIETNGTTKMTVTAGGKVGIGTTNPGANLEVVEGSIGVIGDASYPSVILSATSAENYPAHLIFQSSMTGGADHMTEDELLGKIEWRTKHDDVGAKVSAAASENQSDTAAGSRLTFSTSLNGTTTLSERMRITDDGMVGIGMTDPTSTLDIMGAFTQRGMVAPTVSAGGQGRIYFDSTANKFKVSQNGGAYVDLVGGGGGGAGTVTSVTAGTGLLVGTTAGASITSTGTLNINVGTGSNQIVQLDGSAKLPAVDGSALTNLSLTNVTAGTLPVGLGGTGATTLTSNGVLLGNGTSAVEATTAGAAYSVLRVPSGGGAPAFGAIDLSQSATVTGTLPPGSGGTGQSSYVAGDIVYATGASATSKLGIGGSGTILTSSGSAPQWSTVSSLGFFVNGGNTVTGTATLGTNSNHNLEIETNGTTKLTVLANGNVGIGNSNPNTNAKLEVSGAAISTPNIIGSGANVDLSLSNVHMLKSVGGANINLTKMVSGGSYTLIVRDVTPRTYTFNGCTESYFSPENGETYQQSTYSILVVVDGTDTLCYINWVTGFN